MCPPHHEYREPSHQPHHQTTLMKLAIVATSLMVELIESQNQFQENERVEERTMEEERESEGFDAMGCQDEYRGKIRFIEPSESQTTEVEDVADSSPWNVNRRKLRDIGFIS
ncbi:hypothetical protein Drorol1_Dr00004068 [Drosera rotundifolia]